MMAVCTALCCTAGDGGESASRPRLRCKPVVVGTHLRQPVPLLPPHCRLARRRCLPTPGPCPGPAPACLPGPCSSGHGDFVWVHHRGGAGEEVLGAQRLGECDDVPEAAGPGDVREDAVQAQSQTPMRGCPVLQGVQEEAELLPAVLLREPQGLEHKVLDVGLVDADRATTQLRAVQHQVVGLRLDLLRVGAKQVHVLCPG
mmetsp:Transcript_51743/g.92279  ORF Transcript_51743/g.92279 Transcript_51743/m.92279 type:complete len:201 (-) Transcript_51743:400-1002(-)